MPRIAIDYTAAYEQGGGIGRYVRELTAALALLDQTSDYRLFVAGATPGQLAPVSSRNYSWYATRMTPRWLARIWHRMQIPLPIEVFVGRIQLYHATDFVLPPTLPWTRTLLTVHDLSFLRVPDAASPALRRYLETVVPRSVARADHILADSQATKDDLIDSYRTREDKITVLYSGVDMRFSRVVNASDRSRVLRKRGLRDQAYILSVGTVQPRKNYSRVIRALSHLRAQGNGLHYAIAGGRGWLEDEMYRTIQETGMEDRVHILGFVDDDELPALYSGAIGLVAPSLYEGFGLPVLEAMACGTPVITSNLSSLPEVAGDAAILVDPLDTGDILTALEKVVADEATRDRLVELGLERAKIFTWDRAARQLRTVYDMLLSRDG